MAGSYRENWHLTGPEDRPVENDSNGLGRDSAAKMNFLAMGCRIGRGGVRDERVYLGGDWCGATSAT